MTEEEAQENVSANIERLLRVHGWNTLRLCKELEGVIPQNTVYRIKRGETCGSVVMLASIAEVFGVTVDYLLTSRTKPTRLTVKEAAELLGLSEEIVRLRCRDDSCPSEYHPFPGTQRGFYLLNERSIRWLKENVTARPRRTHEE